MSDIPFCVSMTAFEAACESGNATVASSLLSIIGPNAMTEHQWIKYARLAAQDGHADSLVLLLQHCNIGKADRNLKHAIYCAAGDGMSDVLTLLLSSEYLACLPSLEGLTKALQVAANNGHYNACELLVSRGANVSQAVIGFQVQDSSVEREPLRQLGDMPRLARLREQVLQRRSAAWERSWRSASSNLKQTPVEACLRGFGRLSRS